MPITIPNELPAKKILQEENIFVIDENRATTQDIRPLRILLLNLMPKKIETETHISRILGNIGAMILLQSNDAPASRELSAELIIAAVSAAMKIVSRIG